LIDVRPIGVLRLLDRGVPDDKIVGVPAEDPFQNEYFDIADVPQHMLKEIEHFFQIYKDLEGKRMEARGWEGQEHAFREILDGVRRYEDAYTSAVTP
jgi:inorganic pyrophosphatase